MALLTGEDRFDSAIDLATHGDSSMVDMLVRDIYGSDYVNAVAGLRSTTLASSFGKAISKEKRSQMRKEDLALSCLVMISMNVAALAYLHAEANNAKNIIFTGNFIARNKKDQLKKSDVLTNIDASSERHFHKGNTIAMRTLSYAVSFWSQDTRTAIFCKREGYLGCIGALSLGLGSAFDRAIPYASAAKL